jgi:hypothetical protein
MFFDTRNKIIYDLGMGDLNSFQDIHLFPVSGGGGGGVLTPGAISNVLHMLPATQGTRIYMYILAKSRNPKLEAQIKSFGHFWGKVKRGLFPHD